MIDREKVIKDLDGLYRLIYQSNVDGEILGSLHDAIALLKEQEDKIRQLRLALQILNGNGIKVDTEGR